jgi:hypothetical protein
MLPALGRAARDRDLSAPPRTVAKISAILPNIKPFLFDAGLVLPPYTNSPNHRRRHSAPPSEAARSNRLSQRGWA